MSASTKKKSIPETTQATSPAAAQPVKAAVPALIAFHAIPGPAGKPPILTPIGSAVSHEDGQGFTLDLQLVPTHGGRIILRTLKGTQKPAE